MEQEKFSGTWAQLSKQWEGALEEFNAEFTSLVEEVAEKREMPLDLESELFKNRDQAINKLQFDLYKMGGLKDEDTIIWDWDYNHDNIPRDPGFYLVCLGDASDGFWTLIKDGKAVACFYSSCRGRLYGCNGALENGKLFAANNDNLDWFEVENGPSPSASLLQVIDKINGEDVTWPFYTGV